MHFLIKTLTLLGASKTVSSQGEETKEEDKERVEGLP